MKIVHLLFSGKVLADRECCICRKRKRKKTGSGWEVLEKCETESGALSLQSAALERNDNPHFMAEMSGVDVQVIVAKEFYYHRSCKRDYTRVETKRKKALDRMPFERLIEYIQAQVISGGKVKHMTGVLAVYESFTMEQTPNMKTIKSWIKEYFEEKIDFWSPRSG